MKKLFALLLALMMALSLAACGGGDNDKTPSGGDDDKTAGWPTEGYGALIPEPDWGYEIVVDKESRFVAGFDGNRSQEELDAYKEKLKEAGFDTNINEMGSGTTWSWTAANDDWVYAALEDGRVIVEPD